VAAYLAEQRAIAAKAARLSLQGILTEAAELAKDPAVDSRARVAAYDLVACHLSKLPSVIKPVEIVATATEAGVAAICLSVLRGRGRRQDARRPGAAGRRSPAITWPTLAQGPAPAQGCRDAAKSLEAGVLACRNDYRWKALAGLIS
jgi:hypothetical protein